MLRDRPLADIRDAFTKAGAVKLLVKRLAENDNSKNQVYLAGSFAPANLLPFGTLVVETSAKGRQVLHAPLALSWMLENGDLSPAPHAKLILYPQYPEVRFSGFLRGSAGAPTDLMNENARIAGRMLFFGIRADRTVVALVIPPASPAAQELDQSVAVSDRGVLADIPLGSLDSKREVLAKLYEISNRGWIDSVRLQPGGITKPCNSRNCGGYTLEAQFGVVPNGRAEPDYLGWELKQYGAGNFKTYAAKSRVTLFTPEPTTGVYVEEGLISFVRSYGYAALDGTADRLNFGGAHKINRRDARTRLTLRLEGFDDEHHKITDASGGLVLRDERDEVAAGWPFATLLDHWNRKHAQAVYVPSLLETSPQRYRFGAVCWMGEGTDFTKFLKAVSVGAVVYDPGIKVENATSLTPKTHRRSQFRISVSKLKTLYDRFEKQHATP
jgi:hypothetical protein